MKQRNIGKEERIQLLNTELNNPNSIMDKNALTTLLLFERPELYSLIETILALEPDKQAEAIEIAQAMLQPSSGFTA